MIDKGDFFENSLIVSKYELVGEHMTKHIANILTECRAVGSILLLLFPVFSLEFYITYILCGFTDMVDGAIARKTNAVSELGSRLDTVSDFLLIAVSLIKLLPIIKISKWIWVWIAIITIIKICNIISGFVYEKKLVFLHTAMNKITGLLLFFLPLTLSFFELRYSSIVVCIVAMFSAIQEGCYIRTGRK